MPKMTAVCFHAADYACGTCGRCQDCCNIESHLDVLHTASKDFAKLRRLLWAEQARINPQSK